MDGYKIPNHSGADCNPCASCRRQSRTFTTYLLKENTVKSYFHKIDLIVLILFAAGTLLIVFMTSSENLLPALGTFAVWFLLGFQVVKENERGIKVILGYPYQTVESGPRWLPFLLGKMLHYGTGIVELNFTKPAGIITKRGKIAGENRDFGPANIGASVSFRFRWPEDLVKAVKLLPPPPRNKDDEEGKAALTSIFEEVVLDDVRNVGGKKVWFELARDRKTFAREINQSLSEVIDANGHPVEGNIIIDSGIQQPTVAIDHLEIPPELLASLTAEEIAQLEKAATITRAEGEKRKRQLEGEGTADAKSKLLDAIRAQPENLRIQSLLTLEQMAQGQATTIFPIPTDIMNTLSGIFGKEKDLNPEQLMRMLTPKQREDLLKLLTQALKPQGQEPLSPRKRG